MNFSWEPYQDGLCSCLLEEGTLDDRSGLRHKFKATAMLIWQSLWQSFSFFDESPNGGDLVFRVATKNIANGGLAVGPKRGHEGSRAIAGRVEKIGAEPAGLNSLIKRTNIQSRDPQ